MRRLVRWLTWPAWRASRPARRALMGRFDARVVRLASATLEAGLIPKILEALAASEARLRRIEAGIARADRSASALAEEVDVVLDGLTREVFRLRSQVERIREEAKPAVGGLSLLAGPDEGPPGPLEAAPGGRSRVG